MRILDRILGRGTEKPPTPTAQKVIGHNEGDWVLLGGAMPTASRKMVGPTSSMGEATVYACVTYLSDDIAKVPIKIYRESSKSRTLQRNHPLSRVLNKVPNSWQSAFEWKQYVMQSMLLYGDAFNLIVRNGRTQIEELVPIHPNRVEIFEAPDGELFYMIASSSNFENGKTSNALPMYEERMAIPARYIWHLRWQAKGSGVYGASPIEMQREAVGNALAQQEFTGRMMSNDARPSGILKHPGKVKAEVAKRLKKAWNDAYQSTSNAAKMAVLEEGMEFQALSMNAVDAQFIEQRKYSMNEIGRIFRVPPTKLMDMTRATYSNSEQENLAYVTDTLMPVYERWESSICRNLFSDKEQTNLLAEFDVERLLRGDTKARYDAYGAGRQWGVLSANEARRKEGLNPVQGGDMLLQPLNMTAAGNDPLEVQQEQQRLDAQNQDNTELERRIRVHEIEREAADD